MKKDAILSGRVAQGIEILATSDSIFYEFLRDQETGSGLMKA